MAGRGFLKTLINEKAAIEQQNNVNNVPNASVSAQPNEPVLDGLRGLRGRRALISRIAQNQKYTENLSSRLSTLELKTPKISNGQMLPVSPVNQNGEVSCVPTLHEPITEPQSNGNQQQPMTNGTLVEEKAPVICRVPNESKTNKYHMTELLSNYLKIEVDENKGIFMYTVDFDPPVDVKSAKIYLLNQQWEKLPVKTFDGTTLYLPSKLPQNETILISKLKDETEVTMKIKYKHEYLLNECIHFYNVLIRKIMKLLGLVEFGKSCYNPLKKIDLPRFRLEIWPGYVTSIDEFENGLYICCDITFRILRSQTVLQEMTSIKDNPNQKNYDLKQAILAVFCGSIVITKYNYKTYRIDDVDFSMSPLSTFKYYGSDISFVDYYKKMYNIEITNLKQPMLITKQKKKDIPNAHQDSDICCLVPELCSFTGLTETMKKDHSIMNVLKGHTLISPEIRLKTLIDLINQINDNELTSKKLREWGLTIHPSLVNLQGPVYAKETIILGNKRIIPNDFMNWGLDITKHRMFVTANMTNWALLFNQRDSNTASSFCRQLSYCGSDLGMKINSPSTIKVHGTNPEAIVSTINKVVQNNPELQILVIIFPGQRNDSYNAVKRICCADIGIPSQVIISKTLSRPEKLRSMTQKIALQINCKLGGAGWSIEIPLRKTMIVGIDVYHEKNKETSSVIGFVASMDEAFTQWFSVAERQSCTYKELGSTIAIAFSKIFNEFKKKNGFLPDKIIIYRDGVSESYFKFIEEIELCSLKNCFQTISKDYNPMVTLIIVWKRINTKLISFIDNKYSNPCPGTVLDNTITMRNYFDFYLVSQNVKQGTVNPTHYIVLKNDCKLSVENVQRLSYKLCHMYYNWSGTIKVPAPVQYAHKLAYQIGENVRKMPSDKLANTLYYL